MNMRKGFASFAALLLLAVANLAAAQQSRERRQERRTEPSQPEALGPSSWTHRSSAARTCPASDTCPWIT